MTGRVTAIVSAYFCKDYLDRRIKNLLEQDEQPKIVIVCQKGSHEADTAFQYAKSNGGVVDYILTKDIPTIYHAWNLAIEIAQTPYLTSANSDDLWKPGALKKMCDILDEKSSYAVAYSNVDIVDPEGNALGQYTWAEGGLQELLQGCFLGPMPVWRKSVHKAYGLFDAEYHVAGDYEFWMRLAAGGEKFFHVRESLGIYTNRMDSAEHRESIRTLWETCKARGRYRC